MKFTTLRVTQEIRDRLEVLQLKYDKKKVPDLVELLLDFVEKYNVDLTKEFSNSAMEQIVSTLNETLQLAELINSKSDKIIQQEDKNTTRIVKILQAQERDILKPILTRRIEELATETASNIISNEPFLSDIKNQDITPVVDKKKEEKYSNEVYILERKIESLNEDLEQVKKQLESKNKKYNELLSCFTKSSIASRYNATISEDEYRKFQ